MSIGPFAYAREKCRFDRPHSARRYCCNALGVALDSGVWSIKNGNHGSPGRHYIFHRDHPLLSHLGTVRHLDGKQSIAQHLATAPSYRVGRRPHGCLL